MTRRGGRAMRSRYRGRAGSRGCFILTTPPTRGLAGFCPGLGERRSFRRCCRRCRGMVAFEIVPVVTIVAIRHWRASGKFIVTRNDR